MDRGQVYALAEETSTNGRHLFASGSRLTSDFPEGAVGSIRYSQRQILKEPQTVAKGTRVKLKSIVTETNYYSLAQIIDFKILDGPWKGKVLGVPVHQNGFTLGSVGDKNLRMNPKWFKRVTPWGWCLLQLPSEESYA